LNRSLSIYLDLLRGLAALAVLFGHLATTREWTGYKWDAAGLQNDAVIAFFVLSGYVIAYAARTRHATGGDFLRARIARLWSVVIPLLPITLVLDYIGHRIDPTAYLTAAPGFATAITRGAMAATFTTQFGNWAVTPWSIVPFWSLSYEFAYYVLFFCAFYFRGTVRVAALMVCGTLAGPRILLLLPIWLAGVAILGLHGRVRPGVGIGLLIFSVVAYPVLAFTALGHSLGGWFDTAVFGDVFLGWSRPVGYKYLIGFAFFCNILGFAALADRIRFGGAERPIRWLAGMTLTIYLFHHPLLSFLAAVLPGTRGELWRIAALALVVLALMPPLAAISEHRKRLARVSVEWLWRRTRMPEFTGSSYASGHKERPLA
jgi:peptidoglycan/LPS O-acetylase OafA/YrhL